MNPQIETVSGDLLEQKVDAIVNPWNRNLIPWWLLIPHGVSGSIKKKGGLLPFKQLRKAGVLPLGGAFTTEAGKLPFQAIIHVAGIGHLWTTSESTIQTAIASALNEATRLNYNSIAFPLIGAGVGGASEDKVQNLIASPLATTAQESTFKGKVVIVRFKKT